MVGACQYSNFKILGSFTSVLFLILFSLFSELQPMIVKQDMRVKAINKEDFCKFQTINKVKRAKLNGQRIRLFWEVA